MSPALCLASSQEAKLHAAREKGPFPSCRYHPCGQEADYHLFWSRPPRQEWGFMNHVRPRRVAHACNISASEAKAGESVQVQDQPELQSKFEVSQSCMSRFLCKRTKPVNPIILGPSFSSWPDCVCPYYHTIIYITGTKVKTVPDNLLFCLWVCCCWLVLCGWLF